MPIDDLRCAKCGGPVRHSYVGNTRGWMCADPLCMTNRWVARDGSEDELWNEIRPVIRLHYPDEPLSEETLKRFWEKIDRERDDDPPVCTCGEKDPVPDPGT